MRFLLHTLPDSGIFRELDLGVSEANLKGLPGGQPENRCLPHWVPHTPTDITHTPTTRRLAGSWCFWGLGCWVEAIYGDSASNPPGSLVGRAVSVASMRLRRAPRYASGFIDQPSRRANLATSGSAR